MLFFCCILFFKVTPFCHDRMFTAYGNHYFYIAFYLHTTGICTNVIQVKSNIITFLQDRFQVAAAEFDGHLLVDPKKYDSKHILRIVHYTLLPCYF